MIMKTFFLLLLALPATGCGYSKKNGMVAAGTPVIAQLNRSSKPAGSPGFDLTVNGSRFASGATVPFNSAPHLPMMVMSNQLVVAINASEIATAGSVPVQVQNPGGTGIYMNQPGPKAKIVAFTVQ